MILKNMRILNLKYLYLFVIAAIFACSNDDVREVTLFEKGTAEATASANTIQYGESVDFTSTTTKVQTASWAFAGGSPATSTDANVTVTYNVPGTYEAKLSVKYIDNTTAFKIFTIIVEGPDTPMPYGGVAAAIPGTIEAENYNLGGEGVAYHDAEAENKAETANGRTYRDDDGVDIEVSADGTLVNIGYTNADEWAFYTVEVADAGSYDFDFKVASGATTGGMSIKLQSLNTTTGAITDLGATGDFANTGAWSTYVSVKVSGVNLPAGTNTLRIYFTGGNTNLDKIIVTPASTGGGGGGVPLGPLNIAFVTDNVAADQGYLDLLVGAGHTVEAVAGKYNSLDANPSLIAVLNSFDLIIISRNTNSVEFDAVDVQEWAAVTKPVLNMSSYVARSSRLQYFNSASQMEGAGMSMKAVLPSHPVFTNVPLAGDNTFNVTDTGALHVIAYLDAGNGTLIGTTGNDTYATIAEWGANTAAYAGATVFAGKRMFLAGTGTGFTYNAAGSQLFLNCVEYIVTGSVYTPPVDNGNTLGIFTERTVTESNPGLVPTNNGNLVIASLTSGAFEGTNAYSYTFDPVNSGNTQTGFGLSHMSFTTSPLNATAYNYLNVAVKTTTNKKIRVRHNTSAGNFWVVLDPATPAYGMAWDGAWHQLKIPFDDMKLNGNGATLTASAASKAALTSFTVRTDDSDYVATANSWIVFIDDIFLSEK